MSNLDPFRARPAPAVGARFQRERERHQRQSDLMWAGTLAAMFSDHELCLLHDLGFLSPHDLSILSQCGLREPVRCRRCPC